MGYAKPSVTETLFAELNSGPNGRILLDDQGLIHWHDPRNATDARPWTNSHMTRPLSRTLTAWDGPRWVELWRLAEALGATPQRGRDTEGNRTWAASHNSGDWGFRVTRWRYGNPTRWRYDPGWRATVALARIRDEEKGEVEGVERRNLRDTTPSETLTWAARMGILGNVAARLQNGTRFRVGEPGQEQEVKL